MGRQKGRNESVKNVKRTRDGWNEVGWYLRSWQHDLR